jgi:hypothetical protein
MLINLQKQSLILMQALLGGISATFSRVSVSRDHDKVIVNITLEIEDDIDLEEIDDLKSEFEALQESSVDYEFFVKVSKDEITWPDDKTIVVFRRREF